MQTRKSGLEGMKGEKSFCFFVNSHSLCSSFFQRLSRKSYTYLFSSPRSDSHPAGTTGSSSRTKYTNDKRERRKKDERRTKVEGRCYPCRTRGSHLKASIHTYQLLFRDRLEKSPGQNSLSGQQDRQESNELKSGEQKEQEEDLWKKSSAD